MNGVNFSIRDNIHQSSRHNNDLSDGETSGEAFHLLTLEGQLLNCLVRGTVGDKEFVADLAVDLKHDLDLVLNEFGGIKDWPELVREVALVD